VTYNRYSLVSDEEVKNLGESVEKKMLLGGCESDECIRELMRAIDTDGIIHGSLQYYNENKMILKAVLVDREGRSVRKSITLKRERYIEGASRALANYLLTRQESHIDQFNEWMEDKEEDLQRSQRRWRESLVSIDTSYYSQQACIRNSPFIRLGYGGFMAGETKTSRIFDPNYNEYYKNVEMYAADIFIYRYRDIVGDGVDIYSRLFYKKLTAADDVYERIKEDMTGVPVENFDKQAGLYSPLPESGLSMTHKGGDLGVRFVGTAYFLWEAWSAYLMLGGRFVNVEEKYKAGELEYARVFNAFGYTGALGLEVTLNRYFGIFGEISAGYTAIGDSNVNIDGVQFLAGITLRSDHVNGPFFGFW
ncbi:MAG: hypothetical protein KBA61_10185, partial [Spirochaetes bacterium]|nr:hypothetical protein [Spirochaetota bacterium]